MESRENVLRKLIAELELKVGHLDKNPSSAWGEHNRTEESRELNSSEGQRRTRQQGALENAREALVSKDAKQIEMAIKWCREVPD